MDVVLQKDKIPTSIADVCTSGDNLNDCVVSAYKELGDMSNIYYHDSNLTNGEGDNSYRFAGANPNNYVCFGSRDATCSDDKLYRIIGVFGDNNHGLTGQRLVKVIKNTSIGNIAWNTNASNDWANASLNTTLNSTFKTEKLSGFEDKIAEVTWKVSGFNSGIVNAKSFYTMEIANATKINTAKIGLMYPSEYGFAALQDFWTTNLTNYDSAAKNKDWLYLNRTEWTLSPYSSGTNCAWNLLSSGVIGNYYYVTNTCAVRPSFFLISSVQYVSGSGTSTDPIRIN